MPSNKSLGLIPSAAANSIKVTSLGRLAPVSISLSWSVPHRQALVTSN